MESVLHCAKQGIALRGHRDSGQPITSKEPEENDGNFRAALLLRLQAGDEVLAWHLATCPSNATYTSWKIQNDIISACNILMRKRVVERTNNAQLFAILADGTTDSATMEQLVLVIRFIEGTSVYEEFLGFEELQDGTGVEIGKKILTSLETYGLNVDRIRGQTYDGCAAMKSSVKGAQALVTERVPKAFYVHCGSHSLNLVIGHSCDIRQIRNCLSTLKEVSNFVRGSAKRMAVLKAKFATLPDTKMKLLSGLC